MEVWGWIIVFAVGLTALQLLLYRYLLGPGNVSAETRRLVGDGEDSNRTTPNAEWSNDLSHPIGRQVDRAGDWNDGRRCPHCGTENETEAAYSRCWNCARRIA